MIVFKRFKNGVFLRPLFARIVRDDGNLYASEKGRIYRDGIEVDYYMNQRLCFDILINGVGRQCYVYKAVADAFGISQKGLHVHHIDCNNSNNHVDNLMAISPSEHRRIHSVEHYLKYKF